MSRESMQIQSRKTQAPFLIFLIGLQTLCAAFFLNDALSDFRDSGGQAITDWHLIIETIASVGLIVGIVFEVYYLLEILRRQAHLEKTMSLASGAVHDILEEYYRNWQLTPAERDVAGFVFKGCSIAEIAQLRGSAEGTVKAHLNAVYRKSGASNRSALLSLLIEDLMNGPVLEGQENADGKTQGG
jgi:DNA-binding CsgD family transcriptional regulator